MLQTKRALLTVFFIGQELPPGVYEGSKIGVVGVLATQRLGRRVIVRDALAVRKLDMPEFRAAWENLLLQAVKHPGEYMMFVQPQNEDLVTPSEPE